MDRNGICRAHCDGTAAPGAVIVDCGLHSGLAGDADVCRPTHVREDSRGSFIEIVNAGPWETVVTGTMGAGAVLGHHYHKQTLVFLFLISGRARVASVDVATGRRRNTVLDAGKGIYLKPNSAHAIRFDQESTFILLKSRPYREDDPDTFAYDVEIGD